MDNKVEKDSLWLCIKDVTIETGSDNDFFNAGRLYVGVDDHQLLDNQFISNLDFEISHNVGDTWLS